MIWNPEKECMNTDTLRALQFARLRNLVEHLYTTVPFYTNKFDEAGIKPHDIRSLKDISKLPFGTPVVGAYTARDLDDWAEGMARTLSGAGATHNDTIQNSYGYGLFTGGMGVHHGARKLGATIIPVSSGNTQKQLMLMRDFHANIFTCTPSYALYMYEKANELGIDVKKLDIRAGCFGAEPWSEGMRKKIEKDWDIKAYDIYGLTEITGPGVAFECIEQNGLHFNEDLWYPEIINPDTGEVLPDGEKGELVVTTLTKEGTPLIRYRTRDVTYIYQEPCGCGRTTRRIHRLFGRTDDLLIIRGVNVFPSQIENALVEINGVEPQYKIVVDRDPHTHLDIAELQVEVNPEQFSDETKEMEALRNNISSVMKSKLGIMLKIKLVEPKSIERSTGKSCRVIDNRKL